MKRLTKVRRPGPGESWKHPEPGCLYVEFNCREIWDHPASGALVHNQKSVLAAAPNHEPVGHVTLQSDAAWENTDLRSRPSV